VKSEAPDAFVQPTSATGIGISLRRERAVKRGVEHRHLRSVLLQHRLRGIDAFYLQLIVLRSESRLPISERTSGVICVASRSRLPP
jgi:hypothetical protein